MTVAVEGYTPTGKGRKRPSVCHYCQAPIVWAYLDKKRQALDYLAAGGGNVALEPELPGLSRPPALVDARIVSGVTTHYRRHIESCPNADEVRQRWKARGVARSHTKFERKKSR